jgi:hypothetical protein
MLRRRSSKDDAPSSTAAIFCCLLDGDGTRVMSRNHNEDPREPLVRWRGRFPTPQASDRPPLSAPHMECLFGAPTALALHPLSECLATALGPSVHLLSGGFGSGALRQLAASVALRAHSGAVSALCFSTDGRHLFSASVGELVMWNVSERAVAAAVKIGEPLEPTALWAVVAEPAETLVLLAGSVALLFRVDPSLGPALIRRLQLPTGLSGGVGHCLPSASGVRLLARSGAELVALDVPFQGRHASKALLRSAVQGRVLRVTAAGSAPCALIAAAAAPVADAVLLDAHGRQRVVLVRRPAYTRTQRWLSLMTSSAAGRECDRLLSDAGLCVRGEPPLCVRTLELTCAPPAAAGHCVGRSHRGLSFSS